MYVQYVLCNILLYCLYRIAFIFLYLLDILSLLLIRGYTKEKKNCFIEASCLTIALYITVDRLVAAHPLSSQSAYVGSVVSSQGVQQSVFWHLRREPTDCFF